MDPEKGPTFQLSAPSSGKSGKPSSMSDEPSGGTLPRLKGNRPTLRFFHPNHETDAHHRQYHLVERLIQRSLGLYKIARESHKDGMLSGHKGCVNTINFNQAGDMIVTGSDDRTVKIWRTYSRQCLTTLPGHVSNVFAANFFPHYEHWVVSGGNDADVRLYDIQKEACTVYHHHTKKVLKLCVNPIMPSTFMSCSADGTVRLFDTRIDYIDTQTQSFTSESMQNAQFIDGDVIPQAWGGGRNSNGNRGSSQYNSSLVIDHRTSSEISNIPVNSDSEDMYDDEIPTLFSIDIAPNGNHFIVACADGNVRMYDLRKIASFSPSSYVNIYRNIDIQYNSGCECTGCAFSYDGSEIVTTNLNHYIHVFDVNKNYEVENNVKYCQKTKKPKKKCGSSSLQESLTVDSAAASSSSDLSTSAASTAQNGRDSIPIPMQALHQFLMGESDIEYDSDDVENEDQSREGDESEDEDSEQGEKTNTQTYKMQFKGHYSMRTIKGVNFFGPKSEYVVSGSDDGNVFIWDKKTADLRRILQGHEGVVNSVVGHPTLPMLATGGIDDHVIVWSSSGEYPEQHEIEKRKATMRMIYEANIKKPIGRQQSTSLLGVLSALRAIFDRRNQLNDPSQ